MAYSKEKSMTQAVHLLVSGKEQMLTTSLTREGDSSELIVLFIGKGNEQYTIDTSMHHQAKATQSLTTVRGVLLDNSTALVNGMIKIAKNAQKTQAFLEERILLIGDHTHAQALPKLEIEANDVKASHAATIGRLNDDELFYLQSRGLSRIEAVNSSILGFMHEAVEKITDKQVRESIKIEIEKQLHQASL